MLADDYNSGVGRMVYANGDAYEGEWFEGRQTGDGVFIHSGGVLIREGYFKNGLLHGKGKSIGCNGPGTSYEGEFQDVCFHFGFELS